MARSAPSFSSFAAGEISPLLEGRTDLDKYKQGLAQLKNMIVMPQGGVKRRPGTEFICQANKTTSYSAPPRIIAFQFKQSDTYVLEFNHENMRVIRDGAQVLNATSKNITAITKASPGVVTSAGHGFSNGDEIYIASVGGMTELNNKNYKVLNVTTDTFTLENLNVYNRAIDTTNFTTYTNGGTATAIYQIASPYHNNDLADLRFVQSADTMYFVHPDYAIRTLTRSDHNNWTFATPSISGSPSPALNTAGNYPSVVTFFEQRLVFANTTNNPQTLWFSKNADYTNFTAGTGDNDALIYTIASNTVDAIRYLSSTRILAVGTTGGEFVLTSTNDGPVTPTTTLIRKYSNYGTANVEPVQVADVTLFAQRGGRKVREFKFAGDVNTSGYQAPDMTILAEHLTDGGITQFAYQQEPESIIWALRSDGVLLGLTYRREEDVVGWHQHVIGGRVGYTRVSNFDWSATPVGAKVTVHKKNGSSVAFIAEAASSDPPVEQNGWRIDTSSSSNTRINLQNAINTDVDLVATLPATASTSIAVEEAFDPNPTLDTFTTLSASGDSSMTILNEQIAQVKGICVLPTDGGEDELYLSVFRWIKNADNYETKHYIERLKPFDFGSNTTSAFFVDSGLSYSGDATTSLTGLNHLCEDTVTILANGATHAQENVSNGSITLDFSATTAAVGLRYNSEMQTMRIESGSEDGTSQGKHKRIHAVTLRLNETVGIEVGNAADELDRIPFRDSSMNMDEGIPLFTGDKDVEFRGGYDNNDRIYVRQSQALPLTVLALYPRMNTFDT